MAVRSHLTQAGTQPSPGDVGASEDSMHAGTEADATKGTRATGGEKGVVTAGGQGGH